MTTASTPRRLTKKLIIVKPPKPVYIALYTTLVGSETGQPALRTMLILFDLSPRCPTDSLKQQK